MPEQQHKPQPSAGLTELIGRALIDPKFRAELHRNRAAATKEFNLTPADEEALDTIPPGALDEHARQFGEGAASAVTISIVIKGHFWAADTEE